MLVVANVSHSRDPVTFSGLYPRTQRPTVAVFQVASIKSRLDDTTDILPCARGERRNVLSACGRVAPHHSTSIR